jgi:CIC family chloride channel protein
METDAVVLDESYFFATFIDTSVGGLRHIVATKEGRPYGVIRVNADLRRAIGTVTEAVTVGELSQKNFITVHAGDAMYDVIGEMSKEKAVAAVVVSSVKEGDRETVLGIITKDYIADAVAGSIEVFNG